LAPPSTIWPSYGQLVNGALVCDRITGSRRRRRVPQRHHELAGIVGLQLIEATSQFGQFVANCTISPLAETASKKPAATANVARTSQGTASVARSKTGGERQQCVP
jgi:hypothetical protein